MSSKYVRQVVPNTWPTTSCFCKEQKTTSRGKKGWPPDLGSWSVSIFRKIRSSDTRGCVLIQDHSTTTVMHSKLETLSIAEQAGVVEIEVDSMRDLYDNQCGITRGGVIKLVLHLEYGNTMSYIVQLRIRDLLSLGHVRASLAQHLAKHLHLFLQKKRRPTRKVYSVIWSILAIYTNKRKKDCQGKSLYNHFH